MRSNIDRQPGQVTLRFQPHTSAVDEIDVGFNDLASCTINCFGATIIDWKIKNQSLLYVSDISKINDGEEFRGGIPIVFPQFANVDLPNPAHGLPQHGFAQYLAWSPILESDQITEDSVSVQFELDHCHLREQRPDLADIWHYHFRLIYTITLTITSIKCSISVENLDMTSFLITPLFHTHIQVSDVRQAHICGIKGMNYLDKVSGKSPGPHASPNEWPPICSEIDRILLNPLARPLTFCDPSAHLKLSFIPTNNLTNMVVWNPWPSTESIYNVTNPSHLNLLCLEVGQVLDPLTVAAQNSLNYGQTIQFVPK